MNSGAGRTQGMATMVAVPREDVEKAYLGFALTLVPSLI